MTLDYGAPFFGTSALMRADPDASYLLVAAHCLVLNDLFVDETTLLDSIDLVNWSVSSVTLSLPHGDVINGTSFRGLAIRGYSVQRETTLLDTCSPASHPSMADVNSSRAHSGHRFLISTKRRSRRSHDCYPRLEAPQMNGARSYRAFEARTARHDAVYRGTRSPRSRRTLDRRYRVPPDGQGGPHRPTRQRLRARGDRLPPRPSTGRHSPSSTTSRSSKGVTSSRSTSRFSAHTACT